MVLPEHLRKLITDAEARREAGRPLFDIGDRVRDMHTGRVGTVEADWYGPRGPHHELVLWDSGATYHDDCGNPLSEHVWSYCLEKVQL